MLFSIWWMFVSVMCLLLVRWWMLIVMILLVKNLGVVLKCLISLVCNVLRLVVFMVNSNVLIDLLCSLKNGDFLSDMDIL